jgi:hypothetical protein
MAFQDMNVGEHATLFYHMGYTLRQGAFQAESGRQVSDRSILAGETFTSYFVQ